MAYDYPISLKQVVTKMTKSTQNALRQRNSRMQVELPPGVDFGVEVAKKSEGAKDIKKSNREVARLFGEMFQLLAKGEHLESRGNRRGTALVTSREGHAIIRGTY